MEDLYRVLSDDEQARAARFLAMLARRRFVVARAFLRRLLSTYLPIDPAALEIHYGAFGKPYLAKGSGISFNLSHAEDMTTVAIALQREVGIDIEAITQDLDIDGVARQAFSPAECKMLHALAPTARRDAFFRIWARKEAYIKARGEGLGYPTRSFSVSHLPADNDALLVDDREAGVPSCWRVTEIPAPDGFRAALAAQGRDWSVLKMDALAITHLRFQRWLR